MLCVIVAVSSAVLLFADEKVVTAHGLVLGHVLLVAITCTGIKLELGKAETAQPV
jgi:hypothetical protein